MKTEKTIWQKSREELFQELSSTPEGLTGAEAARRLEHYGLTGRIVGESAALLFTAGAAEVIAKSVAKA